MNTSSLRPFCDFVLQLVTNARRCRISPSGWNPGSVPDHNMDLEPDQTTQFLRQQSKTGNGPKTFNTATDPHQISDTCHTCTQSQYLSATHDKRRGPSLNVCCLPHDSDKRRSSFFVRSLSLYTECELGKNRTAILL